MGTCSYDPALVIFSTQQLYTVSAFSFLEHHSQARLEKERQKFIYRKIWKLKNKIKKKTLKRMLSIL